MSQPAGGSASRRRTSSTPRVHPSDWAIAGTIVAAVYGGIIGLVFTVAGLPLWPTIAAAEEPESPEARAARISAMEAAARQLRRTVNGEQQVIANALQQADDSRPAREAFRDQMRDDILAVDDGLESCEARMEATFTSCERVLMRATELAERIDRLPPWTRPTPGGDNTQPQPRDPDPTPRQPDPDPDPDPDPQPTPPDPDPTPNPNPDPQDPDPTPPTPPGPQFPPLARPTLWPSNAAWPPAASAMDSHRTRIHDTIVDCRKRLIDRQQPDGSWRAFLPPETDSRGRPLGPDRLPGDTARALLALQRAGLSKDLPAVAHGLRILDQLIGRAGKGTDHWYTEDLAACILAMHATTERVVFNDNRPEIILKDDKLPSSLRQSMRRVAGSLADRQGEDGGWAALDGDSLFSDLISTRWALQALQVAELNGVEITTTALGRAQDWVMGCQQATGPEVKLAPLESGLENPSIAVTRARGLALESSMPATHGATGHGAIALAVLLAMMPDQAMLETRRRELARALCDAMAWLATHRVTTRDPATVEAVTTACRICRVWALHDRHVPIWADTVLYNSAYGDDGVSPPAWSVTALDEPLRLLVLSRAFSPLTLPVQVTRTK